MRNMLFFVLLLMQGFSTAAQDVDLDKFYFKTQEILFPKKLLPQEKRTYKFTGYNVDTVDFNENNAIVLNGFKKDDNGIAEVKSSYGGGLRWAEQQTRPRVDPGTNKTFYSISIVAICDGRIRLECKELDYDWYIQEQFRKNYATKEFSTERAALDEFATLLKSWRDDAKISFQKFVASKTNYRANLQFGLAAHNLKIKLWLLNSKDHPDYSNFQKNYELIKTAFAEVKFNAIPKDILTKLSPAIEYFESIPKTYTEDNKKHKKLRYAAYYALMKIYFHVEDFEKATTYANLLITNDYDGKDGKKMMEAITERKALWDANKVSSSHFDVGGESGFNLYSEE